jgi:RND superfamily putative drug exporter
MNTQKPSTAGRWRAWLILALWVAAAGALSPLAQKLTGAEKNDASSWLPRSAEATRAYQRAVAEFPGADTLVAVAVYADPMGLTEADKAKANADRDTFSRYARGGAVSPAIPSTDGQALLVSFQLAGDADEQTAAVPHLRDAMTSGVPPGLSAKLTGPAGQVADITDSFKGIDGTLLFVTAGVVAVLLLFTYRSPVLWVVPLISVGVASQAASAVVYLLAAHAGLTVNGQSQGILTVLVFGAGTDYALLLIARYREELRRHASRYEAMGIALRRSFPAILASAATVAVGLLCLLAAQLNNIRGLGPVGAIGIATAFVAMTTLLPALLVLLGRWMFWPFVPRYTPDAEHADIAREHGFWGRIAATVAARPKTIWIGTALVLVALCLGMSGIRTGLRQGDQYTRQVDSVAGQHLVDAHFASGSSAPAQVLARASAADEVASAAGGVAGVASVGQPRASSDGRWVSIEATLTDPPDSAAAKATVSRLRSAVHPIRGADALVGGQTATLADSERAAGHDNLVVMPLILGVVFLVLGLLLRAIVAPVLLVISVVLSFGAALGAAILIFKAIGHPRIDLGLPLLAFLFLVALGVDYTIFLMTRAREETARVGHAVGIPRALAVTGGVITSAGLILAATFSVLAVLPLVTMLQMGIVVALGVLLDTLVVRTLLVPALVLTVGRRTWWPGLLARRDTAGGQAATGSVRESVGAV